MSPIEPSRCRWVFPDLGKIAPGEEAVAQGADLAPATLLAGYRHGVFGMTQNSDLIWWSPDPRGIIKPGAIRPSRSLRRSARRFTLSLDTDFAGVLRGCADPTRPHGWITPAYIRSYGELHALGWAHSVEVRTSAGQLAGGLLFVEVGGLIAAESMFHVPGLGTDASKLAVLTLSQLAESDAKPRMIDVQWLTPHLASLGAVAIPRPEYLARLREVLNTPPILGKSHLLSEVILL